MTRHRVAAALSAALLTLSLTACGGGGKEADAENEASAQAFGTAVQVQRVSAESIATDNKVSGRVVAEDEATIMVGISAKCVAVYKDAGDNVSKGDILCRLDLASTLSQYNASQINYESAIQQYNDQKAILDEQIAIAEKQAATAAQQIDVQRQQIAAQEQQIPVTEAQISVQEQQIPLKEQQIANAEAQIPVQEQQISVLEQQQDAAKEQLAAAEAQIPVLERQLELMEPQIALAQKNVSDTEALLLIGAASQIELDNAKIQADQAAFGREQLQAQIANTEAQLSASRVQIESLQAQIDSARVGLKNARTQIEGQKVDLANTRTQISSAKAGLESQRAQIEQQKLSLSSLETQRDNAQLGVEQAKSSRVARLAQMEAQIESARASVQQMDSTLQDVDGDGNVIAPISGTLVTFNAVENSYVSNAMPVAVINGEGEMKVTASVSEALVPKLAIGDSADIYVSALERNMQASIRSVERAANAQTRLYTVTLTLSEPSADLLAGMFADVTFHTDRVNNAIVIPSEAILTNGDTRYVYIAVGSTAKYVEVTTGLTGTGVTEILSGLDGGEYLITVGQTYVSDGADIRIVGGL